MDLSAQPDRISDLPDIVLVLIISCLSLKECVQTSLLSKRWKSLYLQTTNVSFKESDFLSPSVYANPITYGQAMFAFVDYVSRWVDRIHDQPIDTFGISISDPETYVDVIKSLIAFAVRKNVKNLVLDFSHPAWRRYQDVHRELVVEIPESFYNLTTLESLEVAACKNFDPSRVSNPVKLKSVSIGWMKLTNLEALLSKTPSLESLSINGCWGMDDFLMIEGGMREVSIKNSSLYVSCCFNLPRVEVFKYSGDIYCFEFDGLNTMMKEVELDFGELEDNHDEINNPGNVEGGMIVHFLNNLFDNGRSATTLTVCPYLLKVIPKSTQLHFLRPMTTQHLVLKTKMDPREFDGIRLILENSPVLETITIDIVHPSPFARASSYAGIDPRTYWMQDITYNCLRETVKAVVVNNFTGGGNEVNIVEYLIRSSVESGHVLERVELYLPYGLDESQKMLAYAKSEMLERSAEHVQVLCAQFLKR